MTTPDKSPGRPKTITSELEYEIILYTTENPRATLSQIKLNLELDVSEMAISKKLKANDLSCRVALRKLSINGNQRACRLQFVNNYIDFTEWNRTIFVDESTFETCYKTRELEGQLAALLMKSMLQICKKPASEMFLCLG